MAQDKSRLHIKKQLPGGYEINVFADSPDEAVGLMTDLLCEIGECDRPSPDLSRAHRDRILDEARTAAVQATTRAERQAAAAVVTPAPAAQAPRQSAAPVRRASAVQDTEICSVCSSELEVRHFKDQQTGAALKRYKCPTCNRWVGPAC